MKLHCVVVAALFIVVSVWADEKQEPQYPFVAHVKGTAIVRVSDPKAVHDPSTSTNCTIYQPDGPYPTAHCDTYGGGDRAVGGQSIRVTTLEMGGKRYSVICRLGGWARFRAGGAQGTGNNIITGCALDPGDYRARWDKKGILVLEVHQGEKTREWKFNVLESAELPTPAPAAMSTGTPTHSTQGNRQPWQRWKDADSSDPYLVTASETKVLLTGSYRIDTAQTANLSCIAEPNAGVWLGPCQISIQVTAPPVQCVFDAQLKISKLSPQRIEGELFVGGSGASMDSRSPDATFCSSQRMPARVLPVSLTPQ